MPAASRLKCLFLAYLSQPACDRPLYQLIRKTGVRSIVELGLRTGKRSLRMIEIAQSAQPGATVRYTGIDLFESRAANETGVSLKDAYRQLKATGARVQLAPGDPLSALGRVANSLMGTDLIVISCDQDPQSLAKAWFFVPRMLHPQSLVFIEEPAAKGQLRLRQVGAAEIAGLAAAGVQRRAA